MASKDKTARRPGTFRIQEGRSIFGELTIHGPKTALHLHDSEPFPTRGFEDGCITGVLHDLTKVSLIRCVAPEEPDYVDGPQGTYYFAKIFAHYVVTGDRHLTPKEEVIKGVVIYLDDAKKLFHEPQAFGAVFIDAQSLVEEAIQREGHTVSRETGPHARVLYYTGKDEIVSSDTAIGRVSVAHRPDFRTGGEKGGLLRDQVTVSIDFDSPLAFPDVINRVEKITEFLGLLAGRPQNLTSLLIRTNDESSGRLLSVYWTLFRRRQEFGEGGGPSPHDVLIEAVRQPDEFALVVKGWFERQEAWRDARWRFFSCFAAQRSYDPDRVVAFANMFDILPPSAVPAENPLSAELEEARAACRDRFKTLPPTPERDSVLSTLGRLGQSSLKRKIRHRARFVLDRSDGVFDDLARVTDEAVKCRNHYVHGSDGSFDYNRNFDAVVFFTNTLEFVFAASDLIEAGWDFKRWLKAGTSMSHPFGQYKVEYLPRMQALRTLLPNRG
jgi:hypothetical protein